MKQPAWARNYKKQQPQIKEQITIIAAPKRMQYTGAGENGIVEPQMPISMVQTMQGPRMIHEGEATMQQADGSVRVVPQSHLQAMERTTNMPGYSLGGVFIPKVPSQPSSPIPNIPKPKDPTTVTQPVPTTGGPQAGTPWDAPNMPTIKSLGLSPEPPPIPPAALQQEYKPPQVVTPQIPSFKPPSFEPPIVAPFFQSEVIKKPAFTPAVFAPIETPVVTPQVDTSQVVAERAYANGPAIDSSAPALPFEEVKPPEQTTVQTPVIPQEDFIPQPIQVAPVEEKPPTPTTPVTPATTPMYEDARKQAFQNIVDIMNGMSQVDRTIANRYLSEYDASSAASSMELAQRIAADPNMTTGAKNSMVAQLQRNASIGRSELSGKLAETAQQRAENAAKDVFNLSMAGQTYDEFTSPSNKQQLESNALALESGKLNLESNKLALEKAKLSLGDAQFNSISTKIKAGATYDQVKGALLASGLDEAGAKAAYDSIKRGADAVVNVNGRIGTMIEAGTGLTDVIADQSIRDQVSAEIKSTDPAKIDAEIRMRWQATVNSNMEKFGGLAEKALQRLVDNQGTVSDATSNQTIRQYTALSMGIDPNDATQEGAITEEIQKNYAQLKRPPVDRLYDDMLSTGAWENLKDTPGFEAAAKNTIRGMFDYGGIKYDENGNIVIDSEEGWPWDNQETFHQYTDWNGKDIEYGEDGSLPADYGSRLIDGTTVTFSQATAFWKGLTAEQRGSHFKDGKPDVDWLVSQVTKGTTISNGSGTGSTQMPSPQDLQVMLESDEQYLAALQDAMYEGSVPLWRSTANYLATDTVEGSSIPASDVTKPVSAQNRFVYYDENGMRQLGAVGSPQFEKIWTQLSIYKNGEGGAPLDAATFGQIWQDGKAWIVDSNGTILNLRDPAKYGGTAERPQVDALQYAQKLTTPLFAAIENPTMQSTEHSQVWTGGASQGGSGYWQRWTKYNSGIYGSSGKNNYVQFKPEFETWANQNVGKNLEYNGVTYRVAQNPIVNDYNYHTYTQDGGVSQKFYADALRVINVQTGKEEFLTFGTQGIFRD